MGGWNEGETWVIFFWFLIFFDTQKKISTIQGSKTTQAIEALYARAAAKEGGVPTGFVVANELDAQRSYVLAKRCGALRAAAASCVVTCHRAQIFPAPLNHCAGVFDRIVCDVPCSGHSPLLQMAVCLEASCSAPTSNPPRPGHPTLGSVPPCSRETDMMDVTPAVWRV